MTEAKTGGLTRRQMLKAAGAAGAVATGIGANIIVPGRAKAANQLRILQWSHFVPAYDKWFDNTYTKEWGEKNNIEVIVDHVGVSALSSRAAAEVSAQSGHDLFMFLSPEPAYEEQTIDMAEVYQECERKHGKPVDLAVKSTYNPKTKRYFGFSDSYVPDPINYRHDLWEEVGMKPDTWDHILEGGAKIKKKTGHPVGIGLSAELDTAMALRAIMYAFGSSVQDERGYVILDSAYTLDAIKFVRSLYKEAMTPEVLAWDPSSNNRMMLAGEGSLALNAISITRTGEVQHNPVADKIWLAKAAEGHVRRIGLEHVMDVYVIWKFAKNIDGAKKFLVDYIDNFHKGFVASAYYNFPSFPRTVPDLHKLIGHDPRATPPNKYAVLGDVLTWATNVGYPGYANAAIGEIFSTWVLNTMFAKAATGNATPEDAMKEATARCKAIFKKWKEKGLV